MLSIEKIFEKAKDGRLVLKEKVVEQKVEVFGEMQNIRLDELGRIRITRIFFPKKYITVRKRLIGYDIADLTCCGYKSAVA